MATSLSYNFQFTRATIIRHAHDLVGARPTDQDVSPDQLRYGSDALNTVVNSLTLKGIRLWSRQRDNRLSTTVGGSLTSTLTSGTGTYYLPTDTLEVMADGVVLRNSSSVDTRLVPMTVEEYMAESNKSLAGIPSRFLIEWNTANTDTVTMQGGLSIVLHPVINASGYSLQYVRTRKLADFDSQSDDADAPARWTRLLVYGLAYELGMRYGLPVAERRELKAEYERELDAVLHDDTPRGSVVLIPEIPMARY